MPTSRFSTMSIRPTPWAPAIAAARAISSSSGQLVAVDRDGHALLERDDDLLRRVRCGRRVGGEQERRLGRCRPGILERAALDRAAPQVRVDRVRGARLDRDLDAVLVGVGDLLLARHAPVADGREHGEIGRERRRPQPRSAPGRCPCRCSRGRPHRRRSRGRPPPSSPRSAAARAPRPAGTGPRTARRPAASGSTNRSANSRRASITTTSPAPACAARARTASMSIGCPTSTSRATTSARYSSASQRSATDVSRPPL